MTTPATLPPSRAPRQTLNLRIPAAELGLIDRAARAAGKTRAGFILSAARCAAVEQLLDRTLFVVRPDACTKLLAMLDAPAGPNDALRHTMRSTPPWSSR